MSGDTRPQCEMGQTPAGFIRTFTRGCRLPYAAFNCAVFPLGTLRIGSLGRGLRLPNSFSWKSLLNG